MNDYDIILAGALRPGHITSLTGFEKDAAEIVTVQPSLTYEHVSITLDNGLRRRLAIETPMPIYPE